jgi:hypothetical protein
MIVELPLEILTHICSLLYPKGTKELSTTCKCLYSINVTLHLRNRTGHSCNEYLSTVINKCDFALQVLSTITFPIHDVHIRLHNVREGVPKLKKTVMNNVQITGLLVEEAPEATDIPLLSSLFEQLEISQGGSTLKKLHLLDCSLCSPQLAVMRYPKAIQNVFLRNIACTLEQLLSLQQCAQLQKLFVEPMAGSFVPRKELGQMQATSQQLEVLILEDKTTGCLLMDIREAIADARNSYRKKVDQIAQFLNGSIKTKHISFVERFLFLYDHGFLSPLLDLWFEPRYQQLLDQVQCRLKEEIKQHPQHVPSLLSFCILQICRESEDEEFTTASLLERALAIEPTNIFAKVMTAYCFQEEDDEVEKKRVISFLNTLNNQLIPSLAMEMIPYWAQKATNARGSMELLDYHTHVMSLPEMNIGGSWRPHFWTETFENLETMSGTIKRLCVLHQDLLGNPECKTPKEILQQAYEDQLKKCMELYPKYNPFFASLGRDDTVWEKSFSPEELIILKEWKLGVTIQRRLLAEKRENIFS